MLMQSLLPLTRSKSVPVLGSKPVEDVLETQSCIQVLELPEQGQLCQVCFELKQEFTPPCLSCGIRFCTECMYLYLKTKITDGEVTSIHLVCPGAVCRHPILPSQVALWLEDDPALYERYLYFCDIKQLGIRFCPASHCGTKLQEPKFSTSRKVYCSACEDTYCIRCGESYHLLRTCRRTDKRYRKWKRRANVRCCPNCDWEIEKSGGCSHMSCQRCGYEFCWLCLGEWSEHEEWTCLPKSLYHSRNRYYGKWMPVRAVTKSVTAGVMVTGIVVGAGIAAIVVPSILLGRQVRSSFREFKHRKHKIREEEVYYHSRIELN